MLRYRPIIIGVGSILGLIVLLTIVAMFLPASYTVERKVMIHAPLDTVFSTVHDLRHWPAWSPWKDSDEYLTIHHSKQSTGAGAWQHWTSESMGNGSLTYVEVQEGKLIRYELKFEMSENVSYGTFLFEPQAEGVQVTWMDEGYVGNNPIERYMGLFMGAMMGADFEYGLANIKALCE